MKRRILVLLTAVILAASLVACTATSSSSSTVTTSVTNGNGQTTTTTTTTENGQTTTETTVTGAQSETLRPKWEELFQAGAEGTNASGEKFYPKRRGPHPNNGSGVGECAGSCFSLS